MPSTETKHARPTRPSSPSFRLNDDAVLSISYLDEPDMFAVHALTADYSETVLTVWLTPTAAKALVRGLRTVHGTAVLASA